MSHHCNCILPGDLHDAMHGGEPGGRVICKSCGHEVKLWEHFEDENAGTGPICQKEGRQ